MMPVLALAATPRTARRAIPFLGVLGLGTDVVSWHHSMDVATPNAVLATTTAILDGLPQVPTAVWVDDRASFQTALSQDIEVVLSCHQWLVDHGAVHVPRAGIDVAYWSVSSPLERAAERDRLGLPPQLVVAVDHPTVTDDIATILTVAAAAVVTGPLVPLALALGAPVITSPETAQRLGLRPGVEVEVASGRLTADRAARAIATDLERAGMLSQRGRRFAEHHLDLSRPAAAVRDRLGLPTDQMFPSARTLKARP